MRANLYTLGNPWNVFDALLNDFGPFGDTLRSQAEKFPRVNAWEGKDGLVMEAAVAGVEPEKLDISAEGSTLTLKGERAAYAPDESPMEFQRSFKLPFELDAEKIKAQLKNGMLIVKIPRKTVEKRRIAIESL